MVGVFILQFFLASPQTGAAVKVSLHCTACSLRGDIIKSEVVEEDPKQYLTSP